MKKTRQEMENMSREDLNQWGSEEGIENADKLSKEELITAIRSKVSKEEGSA